MPDKVIITNPAPFVVQVKGGKTTAVVGGQGGGGGTGADRLSELLDVDVTGVQNGYILIYSTSASKWLVGYPADPNRLNSTFSHANSAYDTANGAFAQANLALSIANSAALRANSLVTDNVPETTTNLYFTAARVRANIANTTPINYDSTTGVISHADSGVTPTTYGNANFIPQVTVDSRGHVTGVVNVAIDQTFTQGAYAHANGAFAQANIARTNADAAFANANTAIYTAAQIRANVSNTAPITYDSTTGVFGHADSGVTATTYGNTLFVSQVTVDSRGHVTGVANVAIDQSLAQAARDHANGAFVQANGALIHASSAYNQANIATTNVNAAFAHANGAYAHANGAFAQVNVANTIAASAALRANTLVTDNVPETTTNLYFTSARVRANISNTTPIVYNPTTGVIGHAVSGVTTQTYGNNTLIPQITVDTHGHVTAITNVSITGLPAATANGQLLIGNTVSGSFDVNALTQGSGILITNDKGSITIAASGGGSVQNAFVTINVAGQANVVADSNTDTLTLVAGSGISITTDAPNDTITIVATGGSALDQFARDQANAAFDKANSAGLRANTLVTDNVPETTTNLYFTAARVRANVSNIAPINYNPATGVISHADSGVTATTYGNATFVSQVTVDARGHVTGAANVLIDQSIAQGAYAHANGSFNQANIARTNADAAFANANTAIYTAAQIRANISNSYPVYYNQATGVVSFVPSTANGQLLIGNTVSGTFDVATLTQGTGILITNDKGSVTIAATGGSALDQFARDQANAAFAHANGSYIHANSAYNQANIATTNADAAFSQANSAALRANTLVTDNVPETTTNLYFTSARVRANISNSAPITYNPSSGVIGHALSGVTATTYGNSTFVSQVTIDTTGHVTGAINVAIDQSLAQGAYAHANGAFAHANGAFTKANIAVQNAFVTINVAGQTDIVADSNVDTLTLVSGNGISISTNATTDTITIGFSEVEVVHFDDFIGGSFAASTGAGGSLGWFYAPTGSAGAQPEVEINHPGILNLFTGGTSGSRCWARIPGAVGSAGFLKYHDKFNLQCVVKLRNMDVNTQLALGLSTNNGYGGEYVRFEKLFADGNVFAVTSNGTSTTRVDTLSPSVVDEWYRFGIRKEQGNTANVIFSVNGTEVANIGSTLPTTTSGLMAQMNINNNAAANKQLWIDYWTIKTGSILPTGTGVR